MFPKNKDREWSTKKKIDKSPRSSGINCSAYQTHIAVVQIKISINCRYLYFSNPFFGDGRQYKPCMSSCFPISDFYALLVHELLQFAVVAGIKNTENRDGVLCECLMGKEMETKTNERCLSHDKERKRKEALDVLRFICETQLSLPSDISLLCMWRTDHMIFVFASQKPKNNEDMRVVLKCGSHAKTLMRNLCSIYGNL